MAQNDIWMPWYIGDYLSKTMHLCTEQHGALLLLLAAYWTKKGPLPDDDSFLAGTTRLPLAVWKRHRTVLAAFFVIEDGFWRQTRADEELAKAAQVSARRRAGGKRTAQRRWGYGLNGEQHANGSSAIAQLHAQQPLVDSSAIAQLHLSNKQSGRHTHTHTHTPNTPPSVPQQEGLESGSSNRPDGGDEDEASGSGNGEVHGTRLPLELRNQVGEVWAIYPKKIETLAAQIAIAGAIRQHGFDAVLTGTKAIVEADGRRNGVAGRGRYLPKPVEFFEAARFLDDPSQYGPRDVVVDVGSLRKEAEELARRVAEHPGNPENTVGSLERKKAAAGEFRDLKAKLIALRQQLAGANVEEEP